MDEEGIDQAVLFPSIGLYAWAITDSGGSGLGREGLQRLARVLLRRGHLPGSSAPRCSRSRTPTRLSPRCGGRRTSSVSPPRSSRPNPCMGRSLQDPAYEPIWSAAEELDVAIGVHEGSSVIVPTLGSDRPFNPLVLHAISHSFEEMLAFAQLVAFGVLERHPDLRLVFLESGGGWAPFWVERLDEQAETFGGFCPEMRLRPSEYFAQAVLDQLRGGRAHAARAAALHRRRAASCGDPTIRTTTPRSPARSPRSGARSRRSGRSSGPRCSARMRRRSTGFLRVTRARLPSRRGTSRPSPGQRPVKVEIRSVLLGRRRLGRRGTARACRRDRTRSPASTPRGRSCSTTSPRTRGRSHVDGERVVVDLELHIDGTEIPVRDIFKIVG